MTLDVGAQTDDGADDTGPPQGRIIARVQDQAEGGVDNYRIEFGFFPQWALDDKDPWSEAVDRWSDWLPRSRFLTKTVLDARDAADNRRWLRSSLISVPAGRTSTSSQDDGADADFEDEDTPGDPGDLIEGRVVARYNPDSRGRLRVEFGFLPEWAFTSTADTQEAVAQYGEQFLPSSRYLTASLIANRRGAWLRSSVVDVPPPPTGCEIRPSSSSAEFGRGQVVENVRIGVIECDLTDQLSPISVAGAPGGLTIRAAASGEDRHNLLISGTVNANARFGAYPVEITARPSQGDPVSATINVRITEGSPQRLSWAGYTPPSGDVGGAVRFREPSVEDGPREPEWTYESETPDVCSVNGRSGELTLEAEGSCRITATSAALEGFRQGVVQTSVRVRLPEQSLPVISWQGYNPNEMAVLGDDSPRIVDPTATVDGRSVRLDYTYEVAESSERICDVNRNSGAIDPMAAGTCAVIAKSAETDEYTAAESRPVRVRITLADPELRWDGYGDDDLFPGADPINPEDPQPRVSEARGNLTYSYSATPRSICVVNSRTGALTPLGEGTCDVTVRSEETDVFLADSVRVSVPITNQPPVCRRIRDLGPLNADESAAPIDLDTYCDDPEGGVLDYEVRSDDEGVASVRLRGSTLTVTTARVPLRDRAEITVTATDPAGAPTEVTFDVLVESLERPEIRSITCRPSRVHINKSVECTASLRGGEPDEWDWRGGNPSGRSDAPTYRATFDRGGEHPVDLTVSNAAGSDTSSFGEIIVEEEPPEIIRITCSPDPADVGEQVTCNALLGGGEPDDWDWSGGDRAGRNRTYETTFSSPGRQTVSLRVSNDGGSDDDRTTVGVDPKPNDSPETVGRISDITVDVGGSETVDVGGNFRDPDDDRLTYKADSDNRAVGVRVSGAVVTVTGDREGSARITVTAEDPDGETAMQTFDVTVNALPEPPDIEISCSPLSIDEGESVRCSVSGNDGGSISTYSWSASGGSPSSGSSSSYSPSFSSAGRYTIELRASNDGGSDSADFRVTVEGEEAPDIKISCSPLSIDEGESVRCSVSDNDGGPISTYSWSARDGSPSSGSGSSYSPSFSSEGRYTIELRASNDGGSDSADFRVTVDPPPTDPPNIRIRCSPLSIEEGDRVTCEVERNRGGSIETYSWSARGGSPSSGSGSSYSPSFSSEGRYTIELRASNDGGDDSGDFRVTVTARPDPPDIEISCTDYVIQGNSARCTVDNDGGRISTYSWSGGSSSGSSSTYRPNFSSFGRQTVRLTARNDGGRDSDSTTVNVVATAPSSWFGRCGSDSIRVYWFNSRDYSKHWLNMTGDEATAIFGRAWWNTIGHLSQSACDSWPTGRNHTTADYGR